MKILQFFADEGLLEPLFYCVYIPLSLQRSHELLGDGMGSGILFASEGSRKQRRRETPAGQYSCTQLFHARIVQSSTVLTVAFRSVFTAREYEISGHDSAELVRRAT